MELDEYSSDSVDEDAELELSCALHDLALRVKTFEANMQGRFKQDDDEEDEITEDIQHQEDEDDYGRFDADASPKRSRRRNSDEKLAKQPQDEEQYESEEDTPEMKSEVGSSEEWDSQEEEEELCELKQNIAKLLQSMQEEAKALTDNQADYKESKA